ncbi:uncharacterized protein [Triticum aestivum]|uniref:uncharacterized protein n=1 Tax=Triticum aestivum TaxID=4565 RepID=UPI001D010AF8|nr:uncharacterized protein LOC123136831 [Triticum aestivum]
MMGTNRTYVLYCTHRQRIFLNAIVVRYTVFINILPDDPLYEDATSFLAHPTHGIPVCRCVLLSTVEVPHGVVTGRLVHASTAKQLVHCDQGARGSWGCSPLACWRYNVDYLETSSS